MGQLAYANSRAEILTREAVAQVLDSSGLLLLSDLLILLLVGSSLQALPWEAAAQEIHKHVAQRLQVISPRLFATKVGVDTHVTGRTRQRLAFSVGNVLLRLGITVLLRHTKVDDVDDVGSLGARAADQEVVGLDVTVDEVLLVDGLDAGQLRLDVSFTSQSTMPGIRTICLATMTTVLMEKRRLQWSKRSSKLGPSRSMTRMLCRPS